MMPMCFAEKRVRKQGREVRRRRWFRWVESVCFQATLLVRPPRHVADRPTSRLAQVWTEAPKPNDDFDMLFS